MLALPVLPRFRFRAHRSSLTHHISNFRSHAWKACSISSRRLAHIASSGIALLEHVNLYVGDHATAQAFYFDVLGLAPDLRLPHQLQRVLKGASKNGSGPDVAAGSASGLADGTSDLIHASCGRLCQMHLPVSGHRGQTGTQNKKNGIITLAYTKAGLATVSRRLAEVVAGTDHGLLKGRLWYGTLSPWEVAVNCPWGQQWRLVLDEGGKHAVAALTLGTHPVMLNAAHLPVGMPEVEVAIPPETSRQVADFYHTIFQAPTQCKEGVTTVTIGDDFQRLRFVENVAATGNYQRAWSSDSFEDQFHITMYIDDFTGVYRRLQDHAHARLWDNPCIKDFAHTLELAIQRQQFRFKDITDLRSGETVMEVEHEIRSREHPFCPLGRY